MIVDAAGKPVGAKKPLHSGKGLKGVVTPTAERKSKRVTEEMKETAVDDCPRPPNHRSGMATTNPAQQVTPGKSEVMQG
jgi:hypothetical protein